MPTAREIYQQYVDLTNRAESWLRAKSLFEGKTDRFSVDSLEPFDSRYWSFRVREYFIKGDDESYTVVIPDEILEQTPEEWAEGFAWEARLLDSSRRIWEIRNALNEQAKQAADEAQAYQEYLRLKAKFEETTSEPQVHP